MTHRVFIVIVNYRTAALAINCLRALANQAVDSWHFHVEVVDNASGDGSVQTIQDAIDVEHWSDWVSVLALDRNGGFAFGNNAGIRKVLQTAVNVDYVMLLNPDTIAHPNAVRALAQFLDKHPDVGIVGSRLESEAGVPQCSAHNAPTPLGELESGASLGALSRSLNRYAVSLPPRHAAHECEWVSGASLMVRREVFEKVGLFDEGYFLYFEEVDFCGRARRAGWQIWYVPESRVVHLEGVSTGIRNLARRRTPYWFSSRRRYFVKYFGVLGLILADILWATGRSSLALRRTLGLGVGGGENEPRRFARDLLLGDMRAVFTDAFWKTPRVDS